MTINNNNMDKFEQSLQSLRKVSLAPEEKGALFKTLLKYAEAHPAVEMTVWQSFVRFFKGLVAVRNK